MWRVITTVAVLVAAAASGFGLALRGGDAEAPPRLPGHEMPGRALVGFQDDSTLRWSNDRAAMLDRARDAGATLIRTTVVWAQAAPKRPRSPASPFDPVYRLADVDELARNAQARGMELLITIWGTPAWANRGQGPSRPPLHARDLAAFAEAIADRYSGRHPGYPAVRLYSAWNEPNLEQFLAPQFTPAGRSTAPALYARIGQAIYDGVKRGNPDAVVAAGETSARGRGVPAKGEAQESHSPARFAQLVAEADPNLSFDAWAQHPYPTRPDNPPAEPVRWPGVGLTSLERFGRALEQWFGRDDVPLWLTEYGHETRPADSLGVPELAQARYAREALGAVAGNPRIRMLVWFVLRDSPDNPWQSGLIAADGDPKPAFTTFRGAARTLAAGNPIVPAQARAVLVPALELAYHRPAGAAIEVDVGGRRLVVPLRQDGWIEVPITNAAEGSPLFIRASDGTGHEIERTLRLQP